MALLHDRGRKLVLVLGAACIWLAGCSSAKQGQLTTAEVTGQVTYRSAPLGSGQITFFPMQSSGEGVRVAYGTLDAQGRYRLSTYGKGDGAILGDHRVAVESREELSDEMARRAAMVGARSRQPKSFIPPRYADPATSGLTARVAAGGNAIDFNLKD